jgi:hypothetical protein
LAWPTVSEFIGHGVGSLSIYCKSCSGFDSIRKENIFWPLGAVLKYKRLSRELVIFKPMCLKKEVTMENLIKEHMQLVE